MKVLITGGAGRLGQYLAGEMIAAHDVRLFDISAGNSKYPVIEGDILSKDSVAAAMRGCDVVVHLAGIPVPIPDSRKLWDINATGTFTVLEAMVDAGVRRMVFASSICAVGFIFSSRPMPVSRFPIREDYDGRPDDIYGLSKLTGESLCDAYVSRHGFDIVSLRLASVTFPDLPATVERLRRDARAEGARFLWNYIDARDAALAFRLAAEAGTKGHRILNVGADDTCSPDSTRALVETFYPGSPPIDPGFDAAGHNALWRNDLAREELGFVPRHSWREYDALG